VWKPIGPSPISGSTRQVNGLVSSIAVSPSNSKIMYIGTAGGGVWRSSDGGTNWTPLFDKQPSLVIGKPGAIAIDPSDENIVYAGTSGQWLSPLNDRPEGQRQGLFKSTDGGSSWIQLGSGYPSDNVVDGTLPGNDAMTLFVNSAGGRDINVIIVDPANSDILYLASSRGIYRSENGGRNWVLGSNAAGNARSLVLDSSSPTGSRVLYAGISGTGVIMSNDGGQNWSNPPNLNQTTPMASGQPNPLSSWPAGFGRVEVDIAPPSALPNPSGVQVLYACFQARQSPTDNADPFPPALFVSKDQGTTWDVAAAAGIPQNTQNGYCFDMAVDPASPGDGNTDTIYLGGVLQAKSTDSGDSFIQIGGGGGPNSLHPDTQSWAFIRPSDPGDPTIVLSGNDGGLARSDDEGAIWDPLNSGGLQTGLFYNIDMKPDATGSVTVGALQDNQVETTATAPDLVWFGTSRGDGWDVAYDGVIAGQVYCTNGFWPDPPTPCTRLFFSTDDGVTIPLANDITPPWTGRERDCYLASIATDANTGGIVYVTSRQNLWQRFMGIWRSIIPLPNNGVVDVARTNSNNVVVAANNQVFLSINALAATVGGPTGVTFANITRGLPIGNRNVTRVAFDPNDPNMIYAVVGGFDGGTGDTGHVFRTSTGASAWTDISPTIEGLDLDIPFAAIAFDGTETPSTIFVGTMFGVLRSVDGGSSWSKLDEIHFPQVPVFDLVLRNGILRAATYGRGVFEFAKPEGPSISVDLEHGLNFGTVCHGPQYLTLEVFNVGKKDLVISSVQRLMGSTSFSVLSTPSTPLVIAPGSHIEFTVEYDPPSNLPPDTPEEATIRIISNDPTAPNVDLTAEATLGRAVLVTAIADDGNFGGVCRGSFADEMLTINNSGTCPLWITDITSTIPEFLVPRVQAGYPFLVSPGSSVEVMIRFQPGVTPGIRSATLTLEYQTKFNDNPVVGQSDRQHIRLEGLVLEPKLNLMIADAGRFGDVCIGSFVDIPLTLSNTGRCTLSISGISSSSSSEFLVPQVPSHNGFPLTIAEGTSLQVPIRFQPTSLGPKSATITVISDDLGSSVKTINVFGNVPSGKLVVTGSTCIGGVQACCSAERTISICNVGDCALNVASVVVKSKGHQWKLINNPFPAKLHPGSCLSLLIRYKATEKCPRCAELVIKSDDPKTPVKTLDLMAYTIWNDCCFCTQCCDDCKRGCCDKQHQDCCCKPRYNCCSSKKCCDDDCCDDEGEDEDDDDDEKEHGNDDAGR